MWAVERQRRIMEMLKRDSRVEAELLAETLEVSRETIRRDLKSLEEGGQIQRTHGGALISPSMAEEPFSSRLTVRTAQKLAIASAAVNLVEPGNCCFIDAGSTTTAFARALASVPDVSVITNSLDAALAVRAAQPSAEVLVLGGALGRDVPATFGGIALDQIETLHADIAFVSPVGIHPGVGISYFDLAEANLARKMLQHARRRVVLADASKCGVVSRVTVWPCNEIDVLVSDLADSEAYRSAGIGQVLRAGAQSGQGISKSRKRS